MRIHTVQSPSVHFTQNMSVLFVMLSVPQGCANCGGATEPMAGWQVSSATKATTKATVDILDLHV